jgi:hypothetical protein
MSVAERGGAAGVGWSCTRMGAEVEEDEIVPQAVELGEPHRPEV